MDNSTAIRAKKKSACVQDLREFLGPKIDHCSPEDSHANRKAAADVIIGPVSRTDTRPPVQPRSVTPVITGSLPMTRPPAPPATLSTPVAGESVEQLHAEIERLKMELARVRSEHARPQSPTPSGPGPEYCSNIMNIARQFATSSSYVSDANCYSYAALAGTANAGRSAVPGLLALEQRSADERVRSANDALRQSTRICRCSIDEASREHRSRPGLPCPRPANGVFSRPTGGAQLSDHTELAYSPYIIARSRLTMAQHAAGHLKEVTRYFEKRSDRIRQAAVQASFKQHSVLASWWSRQPPALITGSPVPFLPIDNPRFVVTGPIGRGGFAEVHQAIDLQTGKRVALKIQHLGNQGPDQREARLAQIVHEVHMHKQLRHPNVVAYIGGFKIQDNILVQVLDYAEGGTLDTIMSELRYLPEDFTVEVIRQVCLALRYLHTPRDYQTKNEYDVPVIVHRGFVHLDIKPANILFSGDGRVWLSDFGITQLTHAPNTDALEDQVTIREVAGTPGYMSPESYVPRDQSVRLGPSTDMWATGVMLYRMLFGERLFEEDSTAPRAHTQAEVDNRIDNAFTRWSQLREIDQSKISEASLSRCRDVLAGLLQIESRSRLTADGVLQSEWLAEYRTKGTEAINQVLRNAQNAGPGAARAAPGN